MFIEVIIDGEIERRVQVNLAPFDQYTDAEYKVREELIKAYLHELRTLYPNAHFQLAYESRMHTININE